jgi:hypothetical protein
VHPGAMSAGGLNWWLQRGEDDGLDWRLLWVLRSRLVGGVGLMGICVVM